MATMESLISLVNRIQRACTILGDYGGDSGGAAAASLPTLWESLPSVAVVGGQVLLSLYISTHTVFLLYIFVCFGNLKWTRLFLKVSLYFPLIFLHCFSVYRARIRIMSLYVLHTYDFLCVLIFLVSVVVVFELLRSALYFCFKWEFVFCSKDFIYFSLNLNKINLSKMQIKQFFGHIFMYIQVYIYMYIGNKYYNMYAFVYLLL